MAKNPELKRFFSIANRLRSRQQVPQSDIEFYLSYAPEIDQSKIDAFLASEDGLNMKPEEVSAALMESQKILQSDPSYKEQVLQIAKDAEAGRVTQNLSQGIDLVLRGIDVASSRKQISSAEEQARRSKRPSRPAIPQRDIYLQNALRNAEEGIFDTDRAIAPVRQQIQDQYLSDVNDAKIASTGQAGAYGAYRQLASNRRNRAALNLAPIVDDIRRGQQGRYDNLLQMRLGETQNQFENQASLYPYDLQQYNYDQQAIAQLGSQGRSNMRNSLYNFGDAASGFIGQNYAKRKYDRLRNQMSMYGDTAADAAVKAEQNLNYYMGADDSPNYWEQAY